MAARCDACGTPDGVDRSYRSFSAGEDTTVLCPCCAAAPELADALESLVAAHDWSYLDKGIGTATPAGKRWLAARAALRKAGRLP